MDHRDSARLGRLDGMTEDHERMILFYEDVYDDDPGEMPARYEVCPTCEGRGVHVNPSIDAHGLSREDFDEDPDFREDYMRGAYDVPCYECKGRRVVLEIDEERCTPAQIAFIDEWCRSACESRAIEAAERRMGA